MSEKCLGCGLGDKPLAPNAYRWVSEMSLPFHRVGGVVCLTHQLAQSREREAALQKLISAQDEQLLLVDRERDTEKSRAEKAEADLKTNAGLLAHQTDLAREAEIGKVQAGRLLDAALPVAAQLDEPVVVDMDGSQCRLVPVGLLLTLREALRARLGEVPAQGEEAEDGEASEA